MFLTLTLIAVAMGTLLSTALYLAYLETAADFPLKPRYRRHSVLHHSGSGQPILMAVTLREKG